MINSNGKSNERVALISARQSTRVWANLIPLCVRWAPLWKRYFNVCRRTQTHTHAVESLKFWTEVRRVHRISIAQRGSPVHADVNRMWTTMSRTMTNLTGKIWCGILPFGDARRKKKRTHENLNEYGMHIILSSLLQRTDNLQKRSCSQQRNE